MSRITDIDMDTEMDMDTDTDMDTDMDMDTDALHGHWPFNCSRLCLYLLLINTKNINLQYIPGPHEEMCME